MYRAAKILLLYSKTAKVWMGTVDTRNIKSNTARATSKRLKVYFHS
jgi:hypothetical protein